MVSPFFRDVLRLPRSTAWLNPCPCELSIRIGTDAQLEFGSMRKREAHERERAVQVELLAKIGSV